MIKISVIVPIYNSEMYLERCLNSILNQTYKNIELILINDGSTDNSGKICDKYKEKDERVIVKHCINRGQSVARNIGIDIATGDFIAFVDSDDWIVEDIYEEAIKAYEQLNCDVVDYKCIFVNSDKLKLEKVKNNKIEVIEGNDILKDYLYRGQTEKAPFSPCRKLYKRNLFDKIRFPEGRINEDISTNYEILMNCTKLVHIDKVGYYYFQDGSSTTRGGLRKKDFDLIKACEDLKRLSKNESDKNIKLLIDVKYARSYFSLLAKIAFYGIKDDDLDEKKVIKYLTNKLRDNYFLLMKSPMPLNRKIMTTVVCIDIRLLSIPLRIYKGLKYKGDKL